MDERTIDGRIMQALRAVAPRLWRRFATVVAAFAADDQPTSWYPARIEIGADGVDRYWIGWWSYNDSVRAVVACLDDMEILVPFRWVQWDRGRTLTEDDLRDGPVADAVKWIYAIQHGDQFVDPDATGVVDTGMYLTALRRIAGWHADGEGVMFQ